MADYLKDDTAWNYSRGLYSSECDCCGGEFVPRLQSIKHCALCGGQADKSSSPRFGHKRSFHNEHQYKGCGHVPRLLIVEGALEIKGRSKAHDAFEAAVRSASSAEELCDRIESELAVATELRTQLLKERTSLGRGRKKEQAQALQPSIDFVEGAIRDATELLAAAAKLRSATKAALAAGDELKEILG